MRDAEYAFEGVLCEATPCGSGSAEIFVGVGARKYLDAGTVSVCVDGQLCGWAYVASARTHHAVVSQRGGRRQFSMPVGGGRLRCCCARRRRGFGLRQRGRWHSSRSAWRRPRMTTVPFRCGWCLFLSESSRASGSLAYARVYICPQDRAGTDVQTHRRATKRVPWDENIPTNQNQLKRISSRA